MEYSELVGAIDQNDRPTINRLLKKLSPRLVRFLQIHMNAEKHDAEDCAQQALLKSLESINEGSIRNSEHILSFLLTSCRNNYLNMIKKKTEQPVESFPREFGRQPRQLMSLLDEERKKLLEWCIRRLSDDYREFIDYWFTFPDSEASEVASHFDITTNNAWIRKHRIIKKLNECYKEKSKI